MEDKYTNFLISNERGDFQQSKEWADVKYNWKNEVIVIYGNDNEIIGTVSILIRKIPFFGNMMYVPRGPVCDIYNEEILEKITDEIKKLQKKYNAFVIRIEPYAKVDDEPFKNIVRDLGYKINSTSQNFDEEIQARHIFRLDIKDKTKDEVFNSFASKTRYNIRLAKRKGVEIRKMDISEMDTFYALMEETAQRNKIIPRSKEYFERLYEKMGEHIEMYAAYYDEQAVSAIMIVTYGNKAWYLYGASGNKYRNTMANYLLQWRMIETAIDKGLDVYDFRGSSANADPSNGLYRFKSGFGTDFIELIGEIYIDFKPLKFRFYHLAERNFRKIRRELYQIKKAVFNHINKSPNHQGA